MKIAVDDGDAVASPDPVAMSVGDGYASGLGASLAAYPASLAVGRPEAADSSPVTDAPGLISLDLKCSVL